MTLTLAIIGGLTLGGAMAILFLRRVVHCVLALTLALIGIAGIYLRLGAQFLGFAQILVYVGAIAIVIVFAILLTHSDGLVSRGAFSAASVVGCAIGVIVFEAIRRAIFSSALLSLLPAPPIYPTVESIGRLLMLQFTLPLELVGILLTVALLGAITIAVQNRQKRSLGR